MFSQLNGAKHTYQSKEHTYMLSSDKNNNIKDSDDNDDFSIHNRFEQIYTETDVDRKTEIRDRIKYGDSLTKIVLSIAFWGFWVFWIIVALM